MSEKRACHRTVWMVVALSLFASGSLFSAAHPTGPLVEARRFHAAAVLQNGSVVISGGHGLNGSLSSVEIYQNGSFRILGNMIVPREGHTMTLLSDGQLLIAGGQTCNANFSTCTVLSSAELLNPANGSSQALPAMLAPRSFHTATLLGNGRVLIAGSSARTDVAGTAVAELYDPPSRTFVQTGAMIFQRSNHTATLLGDGTVAIFGGFGLPQGTGVSQTEIYNTATGTFRLGGSLIQTRWNHTATLLNDGRVLVAGGIPGGPACNILASTEIYDPAAQRFTQGPPLNHARWNHAAVGLPTGRVAIAGGENCSQTQLATIEVFDPVNFTMTDAANLSVGREYLTGSLLPTREALFAGGSFCCNGAPNVYNPSAAADLFAEASNSLFLNNGRFEVTATWTTSGGQTGQGQPVSLTADTGYFWFFGSSNVELVVKVLDGCGLSSHFWVFAGGLTDVNVVLTVRDTRTGAVRRYTNPQGTAFQPIQDTSAFTCP